MREIPVDITLHSQQQADGDTQVIRQQLQGTLRREGEDFLLTYAEEDIAGLGPGQTTLRFSPGQAVMARRGRGATEMRFTPGRPSAFAYPTPYGTLALLLHTEKLLHNLTEAGGSAMIRYRLCQGEGLLGRYTLQFHIKEKDEII